MVGFNLNGPDLWREVMDGSDHLRVVMGGSDLVRGGLCKTTKKVVFAK